MYQTIECRRALSPSGLPGIDYALNPYTGCEHGCVYCYAPGVTHTDPAGWRVVRVKRNIPERLARELPGVDGTIGLGTVTDPYQYAERRFRLSQICLEVLRDRRRQVHIHTKSDLIIRDIPILSEMDCLVGVTITTMDRRTSLMTEPGAPLPEARIDALRELVSSGIRAYALVAPVMSSLEGGERELLEAIASTGARHVFHDALNLRNVDPTRLERMGISGSPSARRALDRLGPSLGLIVSGDYDDSQVHRRRHPFHQSCLYRSSKLYSHQ